MVESFTEGGPGHWLVFSSGAETILPLFLDLPEKKKIFSGPFKNGTP